MYVCFQLRIIFLLILLYLKKYLHVFQFDNLKHILSLILKRKAIIYSHLIKGIL